MVALFDRMKVECVMLVKQQTPDGEGGLITTWTQGDAFYAAIHRESTINARLAEKEGMMDVYTVTVARPFELPFHSVFRRVSDGKVFRTTSSTEDRKTPDVATFSFARVAAQEWELEE